MILPCILKPFPLQGTDNSLYRLRIWAKASRQRGVCVDHLHRCKTSFCLVDGFVLCLLDFELCLQGAPGAWIGQVPTKTPIQCLWYHGWSPWRTCQFFQKWEEAQPKNLHVVHLNFLFTALLSQSGITFDQVWMVSVASEPSSEQGRRKHTSHWSSRWVNHFLLSDFNGLFVHVWCIPHQ